jgi:hypothetical protein
VDGALKGLICNGLTFPENIEKCMFIEAVNSLCLVRGMAMR